MIPLRFATRLNSFRSRRATTSNVVDAIQVAAKVPGLNALELNVPQHLSSANATEIMRVATEAGLSITAINLRFDAAEFRDGAFTHPLASVRDRAILLCTDAVDLAAANGIEHVILWIGPDGFDYPFQVDYHQLWDLEIEGFRRVASRNSGVKVSVEYKPSDPRRISLVRSMADSLLAVHEVDLPNFGVTLDVCHALMAGEQPAAAAAQALRANRLFGVHLNDGYGMSDDGLMAGAIHPWHTLELLWQLRKHGYGGTLYFDTFPERIDPAGECAANIRTVQSMYGALDRLGTERLEEMQAAQDALGLMRLLQDTLWGARRD